MLRNEQVDPLSIKLAKAKLHAYFLCQQSDKIKTQAAINEFREVSSELLEAAMENQDCHFTSLSYSAGDLHIYNGKGAADESAEGERGEQTEAKGAEDEGQR